MKKKLLFAGVLSILVSTIAFSQVKTRAEVRQELIDLESVGFNPGEDDTQFPNNLEIAERKLAMLKRGQRGDGKVPNQTIDP